MNGLLTKAEDEAKQLQDDYISVEHLVLAMTDDRGATGRILKDFGITRDRLARALQEIRGTRGVTSQNPEATYEARERYGQGITHWNPVIIESFESRRLSFPDIDSSAF